jgi:hypothetical protein
MKTTMKKRIIQAISYPILLVILALISITIVYINFNINCSEIIFLPICMCLVNILLLKSIKNEFLYIIKLKIILEFFYNTINFTITKKILRHLGCNISNKLQFMTISEVIQFLDSKSSSNTFDEVKLLYINKSNNFDKFCQNICSKSLHYNLILVAMFIGWIFSKAMITIMINNI